MITPVSELYFAYGSNMSSRRLWARIPAARLVGPAQLADRRLAFNKPARDGSGKANLLELPGALCWGVVWRIAAADWPALDGFEPGYRRVSQCVRDLAGRQLPSQLFVYDAAGPDIPPLAWYLEHLLEGAREHRLPACYMRSIRLRFAPRGEEA